MNVTVNYSDPKSVKISNFNKQFIISYSWLCLNLFQNVYDPHAKCISEQCSITLVFYIISDVFPDDNPFRVERCKSK